MRTLILHPPVLPFGYTLHHRFQRIWEVAAYVRRFHQNTEVVDAGLLNMLTGQILNAFATDYRCVAIYCEPQMLPTVSDLVDRLRHMSPGTQILIYGPAVACFPELIREMQVDAIGSRGDIDAQVRQFFDLVAQRCTQAPNLQLRENGWVDPLGDAEFVPPDEWAFASIGEMPIADVGRIYAMKDQPLTISVTASRGCPYRCTFCATPAIEGRPDRRRPVQALVDYIEDNCNYKYWQFYSPTFTLDRRWCLEFFSEIRDRSIEIDWRCTTRVDRLDEQLVGEMAASGCSMIGVGVETLGPTAAKLKKDISRTAVAQAISLLVSQGIRVKAYILLGVPGQTIEEVRETIAFVQSVGGMIRPTIYSPQGKADSLSELDFDSIQSVGGLDRKSRYLGGDDYGELLRLTFDRRLSPASM